MKHIRCIVFLSLVFLVPATALAEDEDERRGYLSISYGSFTPGGDYGAVNGTEWENGPDFTLSIAAPFTGDIGRYMGMGFDLHYYHTEIVFPLGVTTVNSLGIETLILFQKNNARTIQPYAGIGIGFYHNSISYAGYGVGIDTNEGKGLVAKAGVRVFPGKRLFLGGYVKGFENEYEDAEGNAFDYGGRSFNFELGLAF